MNRERKNAIIVIVREWGIRQILEWSLLSIITSSWHYTGGSAVLEAASATRFLVGEDGERVTENLEINRVKCSKNTE